MGFPDSPVVKNLSCKAEDTGLIPGLEDPTWQEAAEPVYHNY